MLSFILNAHQGAEEVFRIDGKAVQISLFVSAVGDQGSAVLIGQNAADLREHLFGQHEDSIVQRGIVIHVVRLIDTGNLERVEIRAGVDIALEAVCIDKILAVLVLRHKERATADLCPLADFVHEGQAVAKHIGSCIHRMEFHSHVHLLHIIISFSVDGTLIRMPVFVSACA